MSNNITSRLYNLWTGFLSLFVSNLEVKNPEIAYENSINSMIEKYTKLKSATAALVRRRDEILARKANAQTQLNEINAKLSAAVSTNQDDLAVILIQKQEALTNELTAIAAEEQSAISEAEDAKSSLLQIQSKIKELQAEKDSMLAKAKSAEARIAIQSQLDGLSVDAEIQALDKVRSHIKNKVAEANLGAELHNTDLDVRMSKLGAVAAPVMAKEKLAQLKAAHAAKQAGTVKQM